MHPYALRPYKGPATRLRCPACGKPRSLTPYMDTATGQDIAPECGRCNRQEQCQYHLPPRAYFAQHPEARPQQPATWQRPQPWQRPKAQPVASAPKPYGQIPRHIVAASLAGQQQHHLYTYLCQTLGPEAAQAVCQAYQIGASRYKPGATVFWYLDTDGTPRDGKVMLYNPATGKRSKDTPPTTARALLAQAGRPGMDADSYNRRNILYGLHLLARRPADTVRIVESEKSALIAAAYLPGFVWLATGSLANTSTQLFAPLQGRRVELWPDLGTALKADGTPKPQGTPFAQWQALAHRLATELGLQISINPLLEHKATDAERAAGLDLADYLIRYLPPALAPQTPPPTPTPPAPTPSPAEGLVFIDLAGVDRAAPCFMASALEARLACTPPLEPALAHLPPTEAQPYPLPLPDQARFVQEALAVLRAHNQAPTAYTYTHSLPFYQRLVQYANLKEWLAGIPTPPLYAHCGP